jgi:hypothetical protein
MWTGNRHSFQREEMGKVKRNRDNPNEMNELIYREDKTKSLLIGK